MLTIHSIPLRVLVNAGVGRSTERREKTDSDFPTETEFFVVGASRLALLPDGSWEVYDTSDPDEPRWSNILMPDGDTPERRAEIAELRDLGAMDVLSPAEDEIRPATAQRIKDRVAKLPSSGEEFPPYRFWLVYEDAEDFNFLSTAWMVAATSVETAKAVAIEHMLSENKDTDDWDVPTKVLVVPMDEAHSWAGAGPFSVPDERKYRAEGFDALWNYGKAQVV
jgi:hypothetical protein